MSGRHSDTRGRRRPIFTWAAAGLAATVVVVGGFVGMQAVQAAGGESCDDIDTVSLAVDPSIAAPVEQILASATEVDRGCTDFEVRSQQPAETATVLVGVDDERPDLWIPDSILWLLKTLRSTGALPEVAKTSVANTLPVLVTQPDATVEVPTWLDVLELPDQRIGDPLTSSAANAAILGALAESEVAISDPRAVSAALVPIAQAFAAEADEPHETTDLVDRIAAEGGTSVATEQAVLAHNAARADAPVVATVPPTGSYYLNYPLAVTAPAGPDYDRVKAAGAALSSVLSGPVADDAFLAAGFRTAAGTPMADGSGVGSVAALEIKNPLSIETTLRDWALLALPLRTLVVEDVSGSMSFRSGDSTRIALTVDASIGGSELFSDRTEMGLWAFSIGLGGGSQDYRELVPMAGVAMSVDGKTHRERILDAIRGLPQLVGGGTGLYDTTLAAFRRVKNGYDPNFVNSVILLTDGANEDEGSIELDELLATLRREQDPVRPVVIITVGITEDSDPAALQQISAVTGGTSHVAVDPRDIPQVFVEALNSRTVRMADGG